MGAYLCKDAEHAKQDKEDDKNAMLPASDKVKKQDDEVIDGENPDIPFADAVVDDDEKAESTNNTNKEANNELNKEIKIESHHVHSSPPVLEVFSIVTDDNVSKESHEKPIHVEVTKIDEQAPSLKNGDFEIDQAEAKHDSHVEEECILNKEILDSNDLEIDVKIDELVAQHIENEVDLKEEHDVSNESDINAHVPVEDQTIKVEESPEQFEMIIETSSHKVEDVEKLESDTRESVTFCENVEKNDENIDIVESIVLDVVESQESEVQESSHDMTEEATHEHDIECHDSATFHHEEPVVESLLSEFVEKQEMEVQESFEKDQAPESEVQESIHEPKQVVPESTLESRDITEDVHQDLEIDVQESTQEKHDVTEESIQEQESEAQETIQEKHNFSEEIAQELENLDSDKVNHEQELEESHFQEFVEKQEFEVQELPEKEFENLITSDSDVPERVEDVVVEDDSNIDVHSHEQESIEMEPNHETFDESTPNTNEEIEEELESKEDEVPVKVNPEEEQREVVIEETHLKAEESSEIPEDNQNEIESEHSLVLEETSFDETSNKETEDFFEDQITSESNVENPIEQEKVSTEEYSEAQATEPEMEESLVEDGHEFVEEVVKEQIVENQQEISPECDRVNEKADEKETVDDSELIHEQVLETRNETQDIDLATQHMSTNGIDKSDANESDDQSISNEIEIENGVEDVKEEELIKMVSDAVDDIMGDAKNHVQHIIDNSSSKDNSSIEVLES